MSVRNDFIVKYANYFLVYSTIYFTFAVSNNARITKADTPQKRNRDMATKVSFINQEQVKVETADGRTYILGYGDSENFQIEHQSGGRYSRCVAALFDQFYDGSDHSIWGPIAAGMLTNRLSPFLWVALDKDKERERIGNRIKELRKERKLDAKELAQMAGIDAGNLSKIERGQFSVGIDILNKIAAALNMRVDFVPINKRIGYWLSLYDNRPYLDLKGSKDVPFDSD